MGIVVLASSPTKWDYFEARVLKIRCDSYKIAYVSKPMFEIILLYTYFNQSYLYICIYIYIWIWIWIWIYRHRHSHKHRHRHRHRHRYRHICICMYRYSSHENLINDITLSFTLVAAPLCFVLISVWKYGSWQWCTRQWTKLCFMKDSVNVACCKVGKIFIIAWQ